MPPAAAQPPSDPAAVLANAEWLAHRYDDSSDAIWFREVARARHAAIPFATDMHLGEDYAPMAIARADAVAGLTGADPIHFLFHSAYCASTMLVRAMDVPGTAMGLSEPQILNDMIGFRRRGGAPRAQAAAMDAALHLLARPFAPGEAVIVKPSNLVNPLAAGTLTLRPHARAVLLHAPLTDFLLSVARKGLWCRLWCRELLEGYIREGYGALGFVAEDYFRLSDLQVAAVGWLAQQQDFARLVARFGERIATLDSARLTEAPATMVAATMRHYGLDTPDPAVLAAHPALARDSKTGADFAPGQRARDLAAAHSAYGDEIDQVAQWAAAVAANAGVPMTLGRAL